MYMHVVWPELINVIMIMDMLRCDCPYACNVQLLPEMAVHVMVQCESKQRRLA